MRPRANPKPASISSGEPSLFRPARFQWPTIRRYAIAPDSRAYYKSGELPSICAQIGPLNASMGIPFWGQRCVSNTTKSSFLRSILSIAIPLSRFCRCCPPGDTPAPAAW